MESWKIGYMIDIVDCSVSEAISYLQAEEWNVREAILSYKTDRIQYQAQDDCGIWHNVNALQAASLKLDGILIRKIENEND